MLSRDQFEAQAAAQGPAAVAAPPPQPKIEPKKTPWDEAGLSFNEWYRKKLQIDFNTVMNLVNLTRDIISKNEERGGELYQGFVADLIESQKRITNLLFELNENDLELALKINDSICATLEWARKADVTSQLPKIATTADVIKGIATMLDAKPAASMPQSTDEQKVAESKPDPNLMTVELKVGIGSSADVRVFQLPRGSTLQSLKESIPSLKARNQVTFVRMGQRVNAETVLDNNDKIIAVLSSAEGEWSGFDPPPAVEKPADPAPPPADPVDDPFGFAMASSADQGGAAALPPPAFDDIQIQMDQPAVVQSADAVNDTTVNNPFDPLNDTAQEADAARKDSGAADDTSNMFGRLDLGPPAADKPAEDPKKKEDFPIFEGFS